MPVEKYSLVTVSPEDSVKFEKSLKKPKTVLNLIFIQVILKELWMKMLILENLK